MKIGDLVKTNDKPNNTGVTMVGVLVEFIAASHPKQAPQVRILHEDGTLHTWYMQYCEVVDSP